MATPGINAAYDSFKNFNDLLTQFEAQANTAKSRLSQLNTSFVIMSNIFNRGKMHIALDQMAQSLKTISNSSAKLKNAEQVAESVGRIVTKIQGLNKRAFETNDIINKLNDFFSGFKNIITNNVTMKDLSKLSSFSMAITNLFTPIFELGKQKINVGNINNNLKAVETFFNSFVGNTRAEKAAKVIPKMQENLKNGINVGGLIGNFLEVINPEGVLQRIASVNYASLRKLSEVTSALTPLIGFIAKLSESTFDISKIQGNLQAINLFITEFSGQTKVERGFGFFKEFFSGGYIQSITNFVKGGNLLSNGLKNMGSILGSSIVGGSSGLMSLFKPSGLIDQFSRFSSGKLAGFSSATKAIQNITDATKGLKNFNVSVDDIMNFKRVVGALAEIFTGKGLVETIFSSLNHFYENFASIKAKPLTGLSHLVTNFLPFFTKRNGLFGVLGNFDEKQVTAFSRFSRSIVHIFNALDVVGKVTFNPDLVIENIKSVGKVFDLFVGSKFLLVFSQGGFLSKFNGRNVDTFAKFSEGLLKLMQSISFMSKSTIDVGTIKNFVDNIKYMVTQLSGLNFKAGSGLDSFSKSLERVMQNISFGSGLKKTGYKEGFDLGKSVTEGAEDALEIQSPSKVFLRIGKFILSGLQLGLKGISKLVSSTFNFIKANPKTAIALGVVFGSAILVGYASVKVASKIVSLTVSGIKTLTPIIIKTFALIGKYSAEALLTTLKIGYRGLSTLTNSAFSLLGKATNNIIITPIKNKIKNYFSSLRSIITSETKSLSSRIGEMFNNLFGYNSPLTKFSFAFNQVTQAFSKVGNVFNNAIDFEARMTDVFKTVNIDDLSEDQAEQFMQNFGDTISELATSRSSSVSGLSDSMSELFNIAVQAGSAGIKKENLAEFVNTIGELVIASDLSADQGTSEIASLATILQTEEYDRLGSTIVGLGNEYNATESKIVSFAQRLAGVASGTNLSAQDVLALSTAMASVGLEAEAGGTSMTQFVSTITEATAKGGAKLNTFADVAGVSAGRFVKLWEDDPTRVLNKLIKGFASMDAQEQVLIFDELGTEGVRMTDMIRRLAAAEGLLGDTIKTANESWEENTALTEEARKQSATTRASLNRMANAGKLLSKTFFDLFLESFQGFVDSTTDMILKIKDFIKNNQELIKDVLPKIAKGIALITAGFVASSSGLGTLISLVKIIILPLTGLFNIISSIVGILFNPIGLIAGFLAIKFVPDLISELGDTTSETYLAFQNLWGSVKNVFNAIFELVDVVARLVGGFIGIKTESENAFSGLNNLLTPIADFIRVIAEKVQFLVDNLRLIGEAVGIDMGLSTTIDQEAELNALLVERKDIIDLLNGTAKTTTPGAGVQGAGTTPYTILAGDTLSGLSSKFGTSIEEIMQNNPYITDPSLIFAGKTLNIPVTLTDANGNDITQTTPKIGDDEKAKNQARLDQINTLIEDMSNVDLSTKNDTFLDRIDKLADTDIFKKIFGDDSGAIGRAREQVLLIQESMQIVSSSSQSFSDSINAFLTGNIAGGLSALKDGALDFAIGISSGLAALFGDTNPGDSPLMQAASAMGISDTGFGEGISNAGSFKPNSIFTQITDMLIKLGDKLKFLDTIDLTGIQNFFSTIFNAVIAFADPVLVAAKDTIMDTILPAIQGIFDMFSGTEVISSDSANGLIMGAKALGDVFGVIVSFIGTVGATALNAVGSVFKLLVDLFSGIGGLISNLSSGKTDVFSNLNEFLFQPLLNFAKNVSIGTLDATASFLERLTGLELPSGEELFGDILRFFEDMVTKIKIGLLDMSIEFERATGDEEGLAASLQKRVLFGLGTELTAEVQRSIDGGLPLDLTKMISFTYNGETFTGTINDLINGSMGDLGTTMTTGQTSTLGNLAKTLYDQFLTTGDSSALATTIDIYELLGRPDLGFDFSTLDWSTVDTSAIAQGIISGVFNFENLTVSDVSGLTGTSAKINQLISDVFANALGDTSLGDTGFQRLTQANTMMFDLIDGSATLSDMQKGILSGKVNATLIDFIGKINPEMLNTESQPLGTEIVNGVVAGVNTSSDTFSTSMTNLGSSGLGAFANAMDIQSPSGKMIEMGKSVVDGLTLGLSQNQEALANSIFINLITPFDAFNMSIQIVIASLDAMMKKILEVKEKAGGEAANIIAKAAGGLKHGGDVTAGRVYEILEDKLPFEIYRASTGKNYFLSNDDGQMLSPVGNGRNSVGASKGYDSGYVDNRISISIPVVIESIPAGMSQVEKNKLANEISEKVKSNFDKVAKQNNLEQRLSRKGLG